MDDKSLSKELYESFMEAMVRAELVSKESTI